jgi:predicted peptidase
MPPGAEKDKTRKWPLIVQLHGSGGIGNMPPASWSQEGFIMVCPRLLPNQSRGWSPSMLEAMFNEVVAKYPVDLDHVYVMGHSMGGFGTYAWVTAHPERFAAAAPICGGGNPAQAERIKDIPLWVFHGLKDDAVPIQKSYDMVEALRKIGGRVHFTVYTNGGHNVWDSAYSSEVYSWFLKQTRGKPEQPKATTTGHAPDDERLVK